jgi:hypothetical protein
LPKKGKTKFSIEPFASLSKLRPSAVWMQLLAFRVPGALLFTSFAGDPGDKERNMLMKRLTLLFVLLLTLPLAKAALAQDAAKAKEARWEGRVERSDKDKSQLTVRKSGGAVERTVVYDGSTKWVSQYHADKKVNDIDATQVKDGDYVICKGTMGKDGILHATLISKRLSHSE